MEIHQNLMFRAKFKIWTWLWIWYTHFYVFFKGLINATIPPVKFFCQLLKNPPFLGSIVSIVCYKSRTPNKTLWAGFCAWLTFSGCKVRQTVHKSWFLHCIKSEKTVYTKTNIGQTLHKVRQTIHRSWFIHSSLNSRQLVTDRCKKFYAGS